MQITDALKNLAVKTCGSSMEDLTEDQIAELIQHIADNWQGSQGATPSVDSLQGATEIGKELMKAADEAEARNAIGAGTSSFSGNYSDLSGKPSIPEAYTLPAATDQALGGVKKAAAVTFTQAEATAETCAQAITDLIANLKAAGIMS